MELITKQELKLLIDNTLEFNEDLDSIVVETFKSLLNKWFIDLPEIFNRFTATNIEILNDTIIIDLNEFNGEDILTLVSVLISIDAIDLLIDVYEDGENEDENNLISNDILCYSFEDKVKLSTIKLAEYVSK